MRGTVLFVGAAIALAISAPEARAGGDDEPRCVKLAKRTKLHSAPSRRAKIARLKAPVIAVVVAKQGRWSALQIEEPADDGHASQVRLLAYARLRHARRVPCPASAEISEAGDAFAWLPLRWKDGGEAGEMRSSRAPADVLWSTETVDLAGEAHVCFDQTMIGGVSVHVCGSRRVLEEHAKLTR